MFYFTLTRNNFKRSYILIITPDLTGLQPVLARPPGAPKEMLSVSERDGRLVVRINYSSLDIIQTCPRKAQYVLKRKLRSQAEAPALVYGTAIHKALEVFYSYSGKERELPRDFEKNADLIPSGVMPTEKHFLYDALAAFCANAEGLHALPEANERSLSAGIWTLCHYFKTYLNDEYVIYSDDKGPVTERSFTLPLQPDNPLPGGVLIELFGQVDFVLRHERTGVILPGDHKTTSRLGNEFFSRLKPNHQYTAYLLGAQQCLGLDTDSFLVNGIQVKARPLTPRGGPPHFTRQITKRSPEDIAEFHDLMAEAVSNYLHWEASGIWPLGAVNSCNFYGGCTFQEICAAPQTIRENIIKAKFTEGNKV